MQLSIFAVSSIMTILFLLGANMFLSNAFRSPINTVSDALFGKSLYLSGDRYNHFWWYKLNTNISIKEFRLYTFNREKPFINIKNTIFQWRNYTSGTSQRFRAKVRICTYNCNQGIISDEYCTEFNIYSFILYKFLVLNDFIFKLKMFIGSGILLKNHVS